MTDKVDYKELLRKYIKYVHESEGTDFLDSEIGLNGCVTDIDFSAEEIEVLKCLCIESIYKPEVQR